MVLEVLHFAAAVSIIIIIAEQMFHSTSSCQAASH